MRKLCVCVLALSEILSAQSSLAVAPLAQPGAEQSIVDGFLGTHVAGGQPPYSYRMAHGSLPPGMLIYPAAGMIAGKPSSHGAWQSIVEVTDSGGASALLPVTFEIAPEPATAKIVRSPFAAGSALLLGCRAALPVAVLLDYVSTKRAIAAGAVEANGTLVAAGQNAATVSGRDNLLTGKLIEAPLILAGQLAAQHWLHVSGPKLAPGTCAGVAIQGAVDASNVYVRRKELAATR